MYIVLNALKRRNSKGNFSIKIDYFYRKLFLWQLILILLFHFKISVCNICSWYSFFIVFFNSYSNGSSTTVLSKHISHIHRIDISSERNDLKQQKLTDIFISKRNEMEKSKTPSDEKFILARRLIVWFARDLLPLSMVEYEGLNDFWHSLHIGIPLPSRPTVSISALDDMYACMKKELINRISTNEGIIFLFIF